MAGLRTWIRRVALIAAVALAGCQTSGPARPDSAADERAKLASLNTQLAIAYMRDNENELALKKLEKALEADGDYVDAHNAYGLLYTRLGQFDRAESSYRSALRIDSANSSALNNYGQFLCHQGRYEEGQTKFLEAVKNPLYRTPEVAYSNAGTCAMQAKDPATAEQHFRAALQVNPQLAPALLQMASLSFDADRPLDARGYLQRYLKVAPHNPRSLWLGMRIENALGNRDAVSSYSLTLKNRFPDSQETGWLQQGRLEQGE